MGSTVCSGCKGKNLRGWLHYLLLLSRIKGGWHADDTDNYGFARIKKKIMDYVNDSLTGTVIRSFYKVYNTLGFGFLEKVYQNALLIELRKNGLTCFAQRKIEVRYLGVTVGEYYADILVNDILILELKAAECLVPEH